MWVRKGPSVISNVTTELGPVVIHRSTLCSYPPCFVDQIIVYETETGERKMYEMSGSNSYKSRDQRMVKCFNATYVSQCACVSSTGSPVPGVSYQQTIP